MTAEKKEQYIGARNSTYISVFLSGTIKNVKNRNKNPFLKLWNFNNLNQARRLKSTFLKNEVRKVVAKFFIFLPTLNINKTSSKLIPIYFFMNPNIFLQFLHDDLWTVQALKLLWGIFHNCIKCCKIIKSNKAIKLHKFDSQTRPYITTQYPWTIDRYAFVLLVRSRRANAYLLNPHG